MGQPVPSDDLPASLSGKAVPQDDLPGAAAAPARQQLAPPGRQPLIPERMQSVLGMVAGGPIAAAAGAGAHALSRAGEVMDKYAYKGGQAVTDIATKMGASPEVAGGAGYAANVGLQAAPMALGGLATSAAPIMEEGARKLMQSALKPTIKALRTGEAATAINTMLEEGISAGSGGVAKLKGMISKLNDEIGNAIKSSPATVDKAKVAQQLQGTLDRFSKQVNPEADLTAIRKAWDQFIDHPLLTGISDIPVKLAQELKRGTYRQLAGKYGELKGAEVEAQKTLARGLKEEIAQAVPEVAGLNAQESKLLAALNVSERRALIEANRNPLSLALLAHNPSSFAMFLADKSDLFKSLLARAMYSGSEQIPATAARVGLGLGGMSQGRE